MRKILLFFIVMMAAMSVCFTSCEKGGDVLKGTWKSCSYATSSSGDEEMMHITYIFDGKGKYTCTVVDYEERVIKGTYKIENEKVVRLYYSRQNGDGETKDYEDVMELDMDSNPPTLTAYVYDAYGNHIMTWIFEKQ